MINIKLKDEYAFEVYEILHGMSAETKHLGIESILDQLNEVSLNNSSITSKKIVHVQSLLTEGELIQLKLISNEPSTKGAIRIAVLELLKAYD